MIIKNCRICNSGDLQVYIDLGFTPAADSLVHERGLQQPEVHYPLEVCLCNDCGMSQLKYTVPPDILYQHDYLDENIFLILQLQWLKDFV